MNQKQKLSNQKKKKIIIISTGMLILLLISAILTVTVLYFQNKNKELAKQGANILYYSESENQIAEEEGGGEEENNVLVVGLDDENKTNENDTNENKESENKSSQNNEADIPYYIKVNNQANVVTIYKKDSKGNYTVPIKAMICSIGTATPESGVYIMSDKYTWRLLQGDVYGQYACRITGHILFHSVPYEEKDKSTLEWWEYDKLGTKASLGCIRLTVEDAKWIYDNCVPGTKVEFYSSSNPGPLGKPTAQKISDDEEVRNWDPTDPDKDNPWKDYLEKQEEAEEVNTEPVEENDTSRNETEDITNGDNIVNENDNNTDTNVNNNTNTNNNSIYTNSIDVTNSTNKKPDSGTNSNKQNTVTNTDKGKNNITSKNELNKDKTSNQV